MLTCWRLTSNVLPSLLKEILFPGYGTEIYVAPKNLESFYDHLLCRICLKEAIV